MEATVELIADVKPAVRMPAWPICWSVSAVVVAQFAAILVAVTSVATPNFPPSPLASAASEHLQPYLKATLFDNAYRFFAPNPSTPLIFWIRIQDRDGTIRWIELPGEPESTSVRAPYQRHVNLGLQFSNQVLTHKDGEGRARFTPLGEAWLASLVRHVRHKHQRIDIASFGMYVLQHSVLTPEQVRDGWTPNDLRTYRIMPVGEFDAGGRRIAPEEPFGEPSMGQIVTRVLWTDVRPRLKQETRDAVLESLSLPGPVANFVKGHPELIDPRPRADEVAAQIDLLLAGVQ
jgi:hypothetical protein